ncbi:MAG TPA: two-component regulator propeller domain-containing protein [Dokdonella sp.]|uniref:sensor histidine kinase n=1 Tax=Dokdonella sp. TaxID=2291710 RepID=UPI002D808478|nr:two-component regulator propeller domain-containing protein [Dokdonella sp.]HET9033489.1 two-component regulator propeller domain-containing protein [Dokdonella sp.]
MRERRTRAGFWIRSFCLATILSCGWIAAAYAGEVPGIERIHFRTFGITDGLSQATVRAMAQDSSGFLWLGTQDGLSRFDGYEFRVYKTERDDPWSLSQNHVWALAADPDGSLWVGTQAGGLDHYDPQLDRFVSYRADPGNPHALASSHVTALLIDRERRLLVANSAGRMQWFDPGSKSFRDLPFAAHPAFRMVRSMLQSSDGRIWLGAREGLWQMSSDGSNLHQILDHQQRSLDIYTLAQTPNGEIWAGTAESGLYRFNSDGLLLKHYQERQANSEVGLPDGGIRDLLADADGGLWIAGFSHGLARLQPDHETFVEYAHDPARDGTVAAHRLHTLLRGRDGSLFVGSWANGLSVQNPRTEAFTRIESVVGDSRTLPSRQALTVWGDLDGTLWVGVLEGGGLVHLDLNKGVIARYRHDPQRADSLSHDFVQYITRTRDGSLWVATNGGGLNRMRGNSDSFEHFRNDPNDPGSLAEDALLYIFEGRDGTLWIGTVNQGLDERCSTCKSFVHHRHQVVTESHSSNPGGDSVSDIVETSNGDLWLALRAGGLDRFDRAAQRFEHFRSDPDDPQSVGSNAISTLTMDSRGELWVGTQGAGISHLLPGTEDAPRFETFGSKQGLAAEAIGKIMEDSSRKFWISTTVGLSRFDPERKSFINFGPHDGTLSSGYWINGATRLPGGLMAFSGLEGISVFDPLKIKLPPAPRPLATRLLLQNVPVKLKWRDPASPLDKSLWMGGQIELSHEQDNVTVEFAALDFTDPESIEYSYRLDGHDQRWIETSSSRRFATYTDLDAGNYRLRLRTRRSGQAWGEKEFIVDINVAPSAWASPRAFAAYLAALIALAWLIAIWVRASLHRRAQAQNAIRLSEERLKMALWGSGSELWDLNLQTQKMVRENRLEQLAFNADSIGDSIDAHISLVHKDDLDEFNKALTTHLKGESDSFEASYRILDVERNWIWVLSRGRLVERDEQGRGVRMAGTTHDITELKTAEEALRKLNEELEQRVENRTSDLKATNLELQQTLDRLTRTQKQLLEAEKMASLGGLVAGIAHEINTPIGVSVTAASHMSEEATRIAQLLEKGELTRSELQRFEHAALESSQLILRNLQRADRLIRSFKQVAVDQSTEDRRVIDIGICISEILITLGPTLKKTPHQVEIFCEQPVVCETAPGALYQIITNLVMNSLIHGFSDGRSGRIGIEVTQRGDSIGIDYRDNGKGMDEVARARIFDPFFTTRRGVGGSGLGMHIVYNLVTQVLGGTIVVDSALESGFQLSIRFTSGNRAPFEKSRG